MPKITIVQAIEFIRALVRGDTTGWFLSRGLDINDKSDKSSVYTWIVIAKYVCAVASVLCPIINSYEEEQKGAPGSAGTG